MHQSISLLTSGCFCRAKYTFHCLPAPVLAVTQQGFKAVQEIIKDNKTRTDTTYAEHEKSLEDSRQSLQQLTRLVDDNKEPMKELTENVHIASSIASGVSIYNLFWFQLSLTLQSIHVRSGHGSLGPIRLAESREILLPNLRS